MKPELTQKELSSYVSENRTIIAAYRTPYLIQWSHGTGEYVMVPMPKKLSGLPLSKRGHFYALTPEHYNRAINS